MVGRKRGRGSARAAALASRRASQRHLTDPTALQDDATDASSPAVKQDNSDDEMADAPDIDASAIASPKLDEAEDAATPADDVDAPEEEDDADSPPIVQLPRKRRGPGRPPRNPRPDSPDGDEGSEVGTPFKRKRGRPAGSGLRGGFRGRPKYGPKTQPDRTPIDKEGNTVEVVNDEADLPEDTEGETKVDKNGILQCGRDYRVRVFTIAGRGERLYMLSTEPARCTGFRDSYLFFTKHLALYKVILGETEKMDLINRDILPHSYKGRSIGVVTARSVFREFGARIVVAGKKVTDDYQAQAAKERGDVEGEIADPNDMLPPTGEVYNKNQYVAWHGASQVYHNNAPSVPLQAGKPITGKRRMNITASNWQFEHAREARSVTVLSLLLIPRLNSHSKFNTTLTAYRRANLSGVYDTHTNLMLIPKIMQPSHVRWENISSPSERLAEQNGPLATSTDNFSDPTIFSHVSPVVARNFLVTDTVFTCAPIHNPGVPGPDGDVSDIGGNGLTGISADLIDELPEDCRAAFDEALRAEREWKRGWATEGSDKMRSGLRIGFNGFPV